MGCYSKSTKKCIIISNAFQKFLDESCRKPNKIWVDQGRESFNRSMKSLLHNTGIEMYSALNEVKSVVAGKFIKALKNKIY